MIDKTAQVSDKAAIGKNTKIWSFSQVREGAIIGNNCIIGSYVYIDHDVEIGSNCKIENNAQIFHGAKIESGVFIGPGVLLTNDKYPRATNISGEPKKPNEWKVGKILVKKGASIGAASVILPNVVIGEFAMVGAGSVVTKSVPDFGLFFGNPAKLAGFVCELAHKLAKTSQKDKFFCIKCRKTYEIKSQ